LVERGLLHSIGGVRSSLKWKLYHRDGEVFKYILLLANSFIWYLTSLELSWFWFSWW
jgi:hypothetical protein